MIKKSFGVLLWVFFAVFYCGQLSAQDSSFVLPLWKNGAPGFEDRKNEPEQAKD